MNSLENLIKTGYRLKDKIFVFLYLLSILLLTTVHHNIYIFIFFIIIVYFLSWKNCFHILKKTFKAIFILNSVVSLSYFVISQFKNNYSSDFLLLFNLRVFSLTSLTFLFIRRVNLFNGFSFSKTLSFLLCLSYSQIITYKRIFEEFRFSLKSRTIKILKPKHRWLSISSLIYFFLNKSISNSKEITLAMKSRGFFND